MQTSNVLCVLLQAKNCLMTWILQSPMTLPGAYRLVSSNSEVISFKYSQSQQTIRMQFGEHYGIFVLDGGSLTSPKFLIRNVYGSEIGSVTKGKRIENTGTLQLNEASKFYYSVNTKRNLLEVTSHRLGIVNIELDNASDENILLALMVFGWMQTATSTVLLPV